MQTRDLLCNRRRVWTSHPVSRTSTYGCPPKEASKQLHQNPSRYNRHRHREWERERANQGFALQQTEAATYDGVRTLKEGSMQLHRKLPTGWYIKTAWAAAAAADQLKTWRKYTSRYWGGCRAWIRKVGDANKWGLCGNFGTRLRAAMQWWATRLEW